MFAHPSFDGHEQVVFAHDRVSGLRSILAIHNTSRGPALGGCRMWSYGSEDEAVADALRLSRGMTYKAAMADLPLGGGKAVIFGDAKHDKTPALFQALGRAIEDLSPRFIVAEDVGTDPADMLEVRRRTKHVAGIDETHGGRGAPSPATAHGCMIGITAAVRHILKRDDLDGLSVAVQGLGNVGSLLCRHLHDAGAQLIVTDLDTDAITRTESELAAVGVAPEEIFSVEAEVFAPCALGAVLNDETIPKLKTPIIAGAANNQLAEPRHGEALRQKGIVYAPDYVINAGGLTHACGEYFRWPASKVEMRIAGIADRLADIFSAALADGVPTHETADRMAETLFDHRCQASAA